MMNLLINSSPLDCLNWQMPAFNIILVYIPVQITIPYMYSVFSIFDPLNSDYCMPTGISSLALFIFRWAAKSQIDVDGGGHLATSFRFRMNSISPFLLKSFCRVFKAILGLQFRSPSKVAVEQYPTPFWSFTASRIMSAGTLSLL